jgi:hypothetical protein
LVRDNYSTSSNPNEQLYQKQNPEGNDIPSNCIQNLVLRVSDLPPTEIEIINVLKTMKLGKALGGSKMKTEHLRMWMEESKKTISEQDEEKVKAWRMVLSLINKSFLGQDVPKAFGVGIIVLIPKGVPDQYPGIALLEVIYKLILAIITKRINNSINFHSSIHGFRKERGTGTAKIEMTTCTTYNRTTFYDLSRSKKSV